MTTIETHAPGATVSPSARTSSVGEWLTTTDHKLIGRSFIGVSLVGLLGGIVVAALLGIERIDAEAAMFDVNAIPQLFSIYRIGLTFIVLIRLTASALRGSVSVPPSWANAIIVRIAIV